MNMWTCLKTLDAYSGNYHTTAALHGQQIPVCHLPDHKFMAQPEQQLLKTGQLHLWHKAAGHL
jgi:hypothetical protein